MNVTCKFNVGRPTKFQFVLRLLHIVTKAELRRQKGRHFLPLGTLGRPPENAVKYKTFELVEVSNCGMAIFRSNIRNFKNSTDGALSGWLELSFTLPWV